MRWCRGLTERPWRIGHSHTVKSLPKESGVVHCSRFQRCVVKVTILPAISQPETGEVGEVGEVGSHVRLAGGSGAGLSPRP